jgi:hypothetical protein
MQALNHASQAGIASLQGQILELETRVEKFRETQAESNENQKMIIQNQALILTALAQLRTTQLDNQQVAAPPQQVAAAVPVEQAAPAPEAAGFDEQGAEVMEEEFGPILLDEEQEPPAAAHPSQGAAAIRQGQAGNVARRNALARNAVAMLRNTPQQPPIGRLPKTWLACLQEWQTGDLGRFLVVDQREWSHDVRSRFNKRRSIHQEMIRLTESRPLEETASFLDYSRERLLNRAGKVFSLTQHLGQLRSSNPAVAQRNVLQRTRVRRPQFRAVQEQRRTGIQQQMRHNLARQAGRPNRPVFEVAQARTQAQRSQHTARAGLQAARLFNNQHANRLMQDQLNAAAARLESLPNRAAVLDDDVLQQFVVEREQIRARNNGNMAD